MTNELKPLNDYNYRLDINTIQSLDDVKAILDGLELTLWAGSEGWEKLQKYFTIPIEKTTVLLEQTVEETESND